MANKVKLASNTKIYLDTRLLLNTVLDVTADFPRYYKYSVGARMHDISITLLHHISAAYINKDRPTRISYLVQFQTEFETLKTLVRIAGEKQWIKGKGRHAHIVELMDAIGRQCTAWKNALIALEVKA